MVSKARRDYRRFFLQRGHGIYFCISCPYRKFNKQDRHIANKQAKQTIHETIYILNLGSNKPHTCDIYKPSNFERINKKSFFKFATKRRYRQDIIIETAGRWVMPCHATYSLRRASLPQNAEDIHVSLSTNDLRRATPRLRTDATFVEGAGGYHRGGCERASIVANTQILPRFFKEGVGGSSASNVSQARRTSDFSTTREFSEC